MGWRGEGRTLHSCGGRERKEACEHVSMWEKSERNLSLKSFKLLNLV